MSDEMSRPYWDGAARGALVLQQCGHCGKIRHYPQVLCGTCWSFDVHPVEVDGRGTVRSWTVTEHTFDPVLAGDVPFTLVTVDLAVGVRMLGRLCGTSGDRADGIAGQVREGLPVQLTFELNATGTPMPVFVPATNPGAT